MNASDHAFCRWFADPEAAKAFFAPEGLLDFELGPFAGVCEPSYEE